jgi:hypothetical protein
MKTKSNNMNTHPFTIEEYQRLKDVVIPIKEFLPDNQTNFIWGSYQRIANTRESQPCTCPSSGGLWRKAVDVCKNFIKETEERNK